MVLPLYSPDIQPDSKSFKKTNATAWKSKGGSALRRSWRRASPPVRRMSSRATRQILERII